MLPYVLLVAKLQATKYYFYQNAILKISVHAYKHASHHQGLNPGTCGHQLQTQTRLFLRLNII